MLGKLFSFMDKDFAYTREIVINQPAAKVFAYIKPLENYKNWNPFLKKDPNVQITHRGTDGQTGFVLSWEGNKDVGAGEQEIIKVADGKRVDYELRFKTPFAATNQAFFEVHPKGDSQSVVRWQMSGRTMFPMNVLGLVINFDKMIGGEFEKGLIELKQILEG